MTSAVLDASALLALMLDEPGADVVEAHLQGAVISSVNFSEVAARMLDRGASLEFVETEVRATEITIVPFDDRQALETARLKPVTRDYGLSLGDRACLALADQTRRVALTADREWAELDLGVEVRLLR